MIRIEKRTILVAVITILAAGNILLGLNYFIAQDNIKTLGLRLKTEQYHTNIMQFTSLFVEKVLMAQTEVSFDDRLKLENAVRDLKDPEILNQWEKFTGSQTEQDAQAQVKNLLQLLVKKIPY